MIWTAAQTRMKVWPMLTTLAVEFLRLPVAAPATVALAITLTHAGLAPLVMEVPGIIPIPVGHALENNF